MHLSPMKTDGTMKLAVVITCWNYELFVANAIRSVVTQLRDDCELVVVDDGSTDASWAVINAEGVNAFRIENSGQRSACLFGLTQTSAAFVLFLDADDELLPGSIEAIMAHLDRGVAKLQFPLIRINQDGDVISGPTPKLKAFRDRRLIDSVLCTGVYMSPPTSGNVFRRDLCDLLTEVNYENSVDGVILFAAPFFGDVVSLAEPLGRYRVHGRNDSGLGRLPDSKLLRKEIDRFVDRMDHLHRILDRSEFRRELVQANKTFFYLERSFFVAISEGRRASLNAVLELIKVLWQGPYPLKFKTEISFFVLLTAMLPNARARRSVAYRFDIGKRTIGGLLRAVMTT